MKEAGELFDKLVEIIAKLRSEDGCPWDREQTNESIKPFLIEEAYEVIDAIDNKSDEKLEEELGDVLLQVALNSQIAHDEGRFNICDVVDTISRKLIRRHPHVFGDVQVYSTQEILTNWEKIKKEEKVNADRESLMDGIPNHLPELMKARKIQSKASRVGFDWEKAQDVIFKVGEEIEELKSSIRDGNQENIAEEIGDLLFSVVNISRFLNVEPEEALRKTNKKFIRRFKHMEKALYDRNKDFSDYDLKALDELWDEAKREE